MNINSSSGLINWTPTTVGSYTTTVTANDQNGGTATQTFTLTVNRVNAAPQFTSEPQGPAVVGTPWTYVLAATDADDAANTLIYSLQSPTSGTGGVVYNPSTKTLTWTAASVTTQAFVVRVTDPQGAYQEQQFSLPSVASLPANQPPVIRSIPINPTRVGAAYRYPVIAVDPNGDALTYSLTNPVAGMTINAEGVVTWVPGAIGNYPVNISVSDGVNGAVTQSFNLTVEAAQGTNDPPEITSKPTGPALRDVTWTYQVVAVDPNDDAVTITLDAASLARGATLVNGLISWKPTAAGTYNFIVTATDSRGATDVQAFALPVSQNAPPVITSTPGTLTGGNALYSYQVTATDPNAGDTLSYSIVGFSQLTGATAPNSAPTINAASGLLTWTPTSMVRSASWWPQRITRVTAIPNRLTCV